MVSNATLALSNLHRDVLQVGYCYDPRMREHKNLSYDHPEQPARISSIFETLEASGCTSRMIVLPVREVSKDEVTLVHSRKVWRRVNDIECKVSPSPHLLGAYFMILHPGAFTSTPFLRSPRPVCSDDHGGDTEQI